ncbi:MAG TPA: ABC transporter substrate-binding protein [Thermotoga sp.]|nr:ABC transporter substrate-binding protein [Thermotoga sp.]
MRKVFLFVFILTFAFIAIAENVVKIGVVLPMTGGISAFGKLTWEGIQLAYEFRSTVLGKKVELVLLDNRSEKTEAANAVARAIDKEHVVAIIGQVASSHSLAGGEIAEKKKIPMISPSSTNPLVTQGKKFVSRVCFIDPYQGSAGAEFAYNYLNARNVVIFTDIEQDYSVGLSKFFMDTFKKLGGKVSQVFYKTGDQEFSAQLTVALSRNPDVIYITGYYPEIALICQQARALGYTGYFLTGDGADAPELIEIGGDAVEGIYFTTHYHPKGAVTKIGKEFVEKFKEKYGRYPAALNALGFDAYLVLIDAIERAGSLDPIKIAEEIRKTKNFEGATGIITIDENGNAVKSVVINTVKNGKFDYVTTITPGT